MYINGVGLVIDDKIYDKTSNIHIIINQIESNGILLSKFDDFPDIVFDNSLKNISFIILDWLVETKEEIEVEKTGERLQDDIMEEISTGLNTYGDNIVKLPYNKKEDTKKKTIEFIKRVKDKFLGPIFILSNEPSKDIEDNLKEENLITENKVNFIFVMNKRDVLKWEDFQQLYDDKIKESPSIYTLLKFNDSLSNAKQDTFESLRNNTFDWASFLYHNTKEDSHGNANKDLLDIIMQNIESRMVQFFDLEEKLLPSKYKKIKKGENKDKYELPNKEKAEVQRLFSSLIFLSDDKLHNKDIDTGDLFHVYYIDNKGFVSSKYYLNTRRSCSLRFDNKSNQCELYCICGDENLTTKPKDLNVSHIHLETIFISDSMRTLHFSFNNLHNVYANKDENNISFELQEKNGEKKPIKRIGRILHPYITDICTKYSSYFHNPGLPSYPNIIPTEDKK